MSTAWSAPTPEPGDHRAILGIRAGQLKSDVTASDKLLTLIRSFTYRQRAICVPSAVVKVRSASESERFFELLACRIALRFKPFSLFRSREWPNLRS